MQKLAEDSTRMSAMEWFEEMVKHIRVAQLKYETNTATHEEKNLIDVLVNGDELQTYKANRDMTLRLVVTKALRDFFSELDENSIQKLALDFRDPEILVWAELNDNDHVAEQKLLLTIAKVNAVYHPYGLDFVPTIVEVSDNLKVPEQYQVIETKRKKA